MSVVEAKVLVDDKVAAGFAKHPEHVRECMAHAEVAMNGIAAERGRRIAHAPKLVDTKRSALGNDLVELTFRAQTKAA